MPLYFFYTMVQKSQIWPKTQIKGGSCLKNLAVDTNVNGNIQFHCIAQWDRCLDCSMYERIRATLKAFLISWQFWVQKLSNSVGWQPPGCDLRSPTKAHPLEFLFLSSSLRNPTATLAQQLNLQDWKNASIETGIWLPSWKPDFTASTFNDAPFPYLASQLSETDGPLHLSFQTYFFLLNM